MVLYPCAFPPQNTSPQANYEKNIRQISTKGHSTKCLPGTPQNCQGHQKPGKPEKLSQSRGAWDQVDMTTKCNVLPWMGSWNRKRTLGKK